MFKDDNFHRLAQIFPKHMLEVDPVKGNAVIGEKEIKDFHWADNSGDFLYRNKSTILDQSNRLPR